MSRSATTPAIAGHGRTTVLLPVPPPYGVERRGRRVHVRRGRCGGHDRASTPVVVTRRIDGRAGQGVSTPTWMATVKPHPTANAGPGHRRSPHGVAAVSPRIASRRRHRVRAALACSCTQTRTGEMRQPFPARRPGMTGRSLLMGLIGRQLGAVGRAQRYGPRSRCTADDVIRWWCVVVRRCHVGAARSPGPPDPCHLLNACDQARIRTVDEAKGRPLSPDKACVSGAGTALRFGRHEERAAPKKLPICDVPPAGCSANGQQCSHAVGRQKLTTSESFQLGRTR